MPKIGTGSVSILACVRSEGPAVSSPVREGGEPDPLDSPEARRAGTNRCRTFGAQVTNRHIYPALTDGATNCPSFGPKSSK